MSAVNDRKKTMTRMRTLLALPLLLGACGGAAPHTGYPSDNEPWTSPTKLRLKDTGDVSVEGTVNFAKRERAKWYAVELPAPGNLQAKLKLDPKSTGADVGFEILDEGFNVVAQPIDDNDVGQDDKLRNVREARKGRYYFHIYTLQHSDITDFKMRVRFDPLVPVTTVTVTPDQPADPKSVFPWTVPNLPPLAQVPAADDTPRGRPQKDEPAEEPGPKIEADPWQSVTLTGTISEFKQVSSGVLITINRGSGGGVQDGMIGAVVDKSGRSLPKGTFKVKKVGTDECEGIVGLTLDQVQNNRRVKLKQAQ